MSYHYDLVFRDKDETELGRTCVELDKPWLHPSARKSVYPLVAAMTAGMTMTVESQRGGDVIEKAL